jgi:hypothetical protein
MLMVQFLKVARLAQSVWVATGMQGRRSTVMRLRSLAVMTQTSGMELFVAIARFGPNASHNGREYSPLPAVSCHS